MAYLHEVDVNELPFDAHAATDETEKKNFVHDVIWLLYNRFKDRSIRLKKLGIPLSFKVSQLRPVIEILVGEEGNGIQ